MNEKEAIDELKKRDFIEELKKVLSLKWVEHVVFWAIVLLATGVAGIIVTNYVLNYIHLPK